MFRIILLDSACVILISEQMCFKVFSFKQVFSFEKKKDKHDRFQKLRQKKRQKTKKKKRKENTQVNIK